MIQEIKNHFIKLLGMTLIVSVVFNMPTSLFSEDLGVPILGVKTKQLPWTTFPGLLARLGWELDNWPRGVPIPGSGDSACDDNRGINGLDMKQLCLLYDAMKSKTHPLGFRKVDTTSGAADGSQYSSGSTPTSEADLQDSTPVFPNGVVHESIIIEFDISRKRPHAAHDTRDTDNVDARLEKRPRLALLGEDHMPVG